MAAKKKLDEATQAQLDTLLDGVKKAKTLDDLLAGLLAIAHGGEIGQLAQRKMPLPFRSFGGAHPELEGALSWDLQRVLMAGEEGLDGCRIVQRKKRGDAEESTAPTKAAPASDSSDTSAPEGEAGAEGAPAAAAPADDAPPGADPEEVAKQLFEALVAKKQSPTKVLGQRLPGGRGKVTIKGEGPVQHFELSAEHWAESVPTIVRGVVAAMGGGE